MVVLLWAISMCEKVNWYVKSLTLKAEKAFAVCSVLQIYKATVSTFHAEGEDDGVTEFDSRIYFHA